MIHRFGRFIASLTITVVFSALLLVGVDSAHAQSSQSQVITVSPASTNLSVDPGSTASKTFDIINSGEQSFGVSVTSAPYYVSGVNYDPQFTQLPGTVDASKWVRFTETTLTIEGGKTVALPYSVEVPSGTSPGGYYAVIFVETTTDNTKTGVVSRNRVGNILYMTVNGDVKSGGKVTGNALPSVSFVGSIKIGAKISNSGGAHFITQAKYSVKNLSEKEVFSATIERYVLPQTERDITTAWSPQSLFGIFTVQRSATIDGTVQNLPDEKIVIINPWVLVIVTFFIGMLIGIPVERARRRRNAK